jgi:hypothetical protein
MSIQIEPNTGFPYTVSTLVESGKDVDYIYISDWCNLHVGQLDTNWTMRWDNNRGMIFAFINKLDAGFFKLAWG